uniref:Uncharacterized protein n=1 Tax=Rhizophagus irregularis (strain DAOM 181602 / DAOM 197198 / MUCL 43194) TaxID=747089 RepID=U9U7A4_RHIID
MCSVPIVYNQNVITSQDTTYSGDQFPTEIRLLDDLFKEINKPQFGNFLSCINEEDICCTFYCNICQVLNILLPDYKFSRQSVPITSIPDFPAMFASFEFIVPIEIKREHGLQLYY